MTISRYQVTKRKPAEARTTTDGQVFDSVAEMKRYEELRSRLDVRAIQRQIRFPLMMRDEYCVLQHVTYTPSNRKAFYTLDFQYEELQNTTHGGSEWVTVYEEYKGFDDDASKLRRAHVETFKRIKIRLTGPAAKRKKSL